MRKLREENDATAALIILDEHDRRFASSGSLEGEANLTRIEAWMRTGQHPRALARLDALALQSLGQARELLAARADLRAEVGRCKEARVDFDALLGPEAPRDSVTERALFGRASCRARGGDELGARADLERYLARFPEGRFAPAARAALDR